MHRHVVCHPSGSSGGCRTRGARSHGTAADHDAMPGSRSVRELLHTSKLLTPTDLAGFRSDPRGHCYIARHWLIYCTPSGALCGTVSWGRPDLQQVRELEAVTDSVLG